MTNARDSIPFRWVAPAIIVLAVLLAYANSLRTPFLFDDAGAVQNNPTIRKLWSLDVLRPLADGSTTTGRPVVNVSFALNYALSGDRVWSYHALNVALHAGAVLLLLGVVGAAASSPRSGVDAAGTPHPQSNTAAFCVALLWALHPLQTETVVSAAQRTELLCALFHLLTVYAFIRGRLGLSIAYCLLGMGTKEVMVTAPLLVLLYDRTFVAGTFATAWRARRGYYLALAGTWLLLGALVAQGGGTRGASAGAGLGVSWWHYLLQQCEALVLYLKLSLWPHPLVIDYGTGVARSIADVWWQGAIVVTLLAGTGWALVRRPRLGFAGAVFFLVLAPSSSFVPLVTQTMAEHRMYLPLASVLVVVVLGLFRVAARAAPWICGVGAVAGLLVTVARNHDYRDAVAIWADNVAKRPQVARGHLNLAWALQRAGRGAEANVHFARAVQLDAGYVSAHYNWGASLLDQGRVDEAIVELETAVRLAPDHAAAHLNLGTALMQRDRTREAILHFEAALRLHPGADAHYNLGVALDASGDGAGAQRHFTAAASLPEARYRLGRIAERAGNFAESEAHYAAVIGADPAHAAAHARLGLLFARTDRLPRAAEALRTAVRLRPDDADFQANFGNVLLLQGQVAEAIACFETALRLRPNDSRLRESLEVARQARR